MGKPHGQGRYAALRLAVAGLRTVQLSTLLSGVLLMWCSSASALDPSLDISQYAHTAWKVRDGFFKSGINAIAQTPDGYLWLGTDFGLLRFDGIRAVPWQPPAGEQLPSTVIRRLLVSRDGTLWIGTTKGLASWTDGKLRIYPELTGIASLLEDAERTVWAGEWVWPRGGKLCAIRNGSVQCSGNDGSLGPGVLSLYEDLKGNLWAGGLGGFWHWKPGAPKFYPLPGQPHETTNSFAEDDDGAFLIGTQGGISRLVDGKIEKYAPSTAVLGLYASKMLRDRDAGLWIGIVSGGLAHTHQSRTDTFDQLDGLSGDSVSALFQDREGNVWVATNNGLDRFREYTVPTVPVKHGLSTYPGAGVLVARDGNVWVDVVKGLARLHDSGIAVSRKQKAPVSNHQGQAIREITYIGRPDTLFALLEDGRGRIWVSSRDRFGYLDNDHFHSISAVPGRVVIGVAEDMAGDLWVPQQDLGLFQLRQENAVQQIPWARLGHKDPSSALIADPLRGGLWIGFLNGGITYYNDGKVRASYTVAEGLGEGRVNDLRFDRDGTLWAATEGGLSRLKNGRIATLTRKNGLPCETAHWVLKDDERSFWLYMGCGLVRISQSEMEAWAADPKRIVQATVFDSSDGVTSAAFFVGIGPQVGKSPDGRLWFCGMDGLSVLDPRHLPYNKLPPPVHIEQITADRNVSWQNSWSDAPSNLRLPALTRDLEIDYTAPSFVVPEKVQFRYKLEGWDRDWRDAGNRRQAFYSNLSPRNYRFRVAASNNSGVWNEAGTFLDFSVAPAYYQTNWFRALCAAAFLALLWALYQFRLHQLQQRFNAGLEARVNERTRIARELHDSLLQGFQGLMFRLQAVRDMLPGRAPAEAIEALDIALERGDEAIAEGRDTVSDLREPVLGDSDIAQALTALGKELALQSGNGLVPCVRVLLEGKQRELNPMLRDEIYRIAREALRNAFLHARAQKIEAEITYSDYEFLLHVRDDGGGIDPEVANQGARAGHWGLPGMRERAKSFGGQLEVWSEHGAGTEIELSVPGAIAYGKSEPPRRFWLWRKKIGESDGQQS
jgi:signal transduction histidine kinase/ligand-binding sensor domain-containing protein